MTLIQLQYVLSVAEHKNFTTAAEKSFVTQPTLSMQIQKLEKELNTEIFDRTTHPITITVIGEKIINQAKKILAEAKKMNQMVLEEKGSIEGVVNLGIIPTVFPSLVPLFYKTFRKNFPKTNLVIKELRTDEIIKGLHNGNIDFGIAATPLRENQIIEKNIYEEPLVAYIPRNHPLNKEEKITLDQIKQYDLLLLGEGHCFRENVMNICDNTANINKHEIQSGDFSTLIKLCDEGYGITILPLLYVNDLKDENKKNIKYIVDNPIPARKVSLIYQESQIRLHFKEEFFKLIQGIIRAILFLEDASNTPKIKLI